MGLGHMGLGQMGLGKTVGGSENETGDARLIRAKLRLSEYVNNAIPGICLCGRGHSEWV